MAETTALNFDETTGRATVDRSKPLSWQDGQAIMERNNRIADEIERLLVFRRLMEANAEGGDDEPMTAAEWIKYCDMRASDLKKQDAPVGGAEG